MVTQTKTHHGQARPAQGAPPPPNAGPPLAAWLPLARFLRSGS